MKSCILSPSSFNLHAEVIIRKLELKESKIGLKIEWKNINKLFFQKPKKAWNTSIKRRKQEIWPVPEHHRDQDHYEEWKCQITIDGKETECMQEFTFQGTQIDQSSKCSLK